jgi:type I restriction enzyme, S subunit
MVKLGEVSKAQSGVGFPTEYQGKSYGDYPLAKVSDISNAVRTNNGILDTAVNWVTNDIANQLNATVFPHGTVLFAKIGEGLKLNRRGFATRTVLADNNVMGLIPNLSKIEPKYLYYFMLTVDLANYAQTTAVPSVRSGDVLNIRIPLPPLDEQKRIAAILEEADHARRTRRFTQSVSDTFLQEVFVDMFGDPVTNPMGWDVMKLGKFNDVQGGLQLSQHRNSHELKRPYLRVANVYDNRLDLSEIKFIGLTHDEAGRTRLEANDILVVEGHGNIKGIGRCAIWDGSIPNCVHQNHLIRVRPNYQKTNSIYLSRFLNSAGGRYYLEMISNTTSGLNTISTGKLKDCPILLPPLSLQKEFTSIVLQQNKVEEQQQESARQAEHLFQTLLHRAFRGEL